MLSTFALRRLAPLAALLLSGVATALPPTDPQAVAGPHPGYVIGYLASDEVPDSLRFLPPPPAPGSAAQAADEAAYADTRALRGTPRWALAERDADLTFPNAAGAFSCALDVAISAEATPHLNMLLRRIRTDASRANDSAKRHYQRQRPYLAHGDSSCTPQAKLKNDSYPSGHTSIGWAWALALAEIVPDRANAVFARGYAYGESRVICGVHWKSDTDAGRLVGAATIARLHANPVFQEQLALARQEIAAARTAGQHTPRDCAGEAAAPLALPPQATDR